jgi:TonB-linked SusC/RagA family outer membrane protein
MQMTVHSKMRNVPFPKLLFVFLLSTILFHSGYCQNISLSLKQVSLERAFKEIESKIDQRFVYTRDMMDQTHSVSVDVKDAPLKSVLDLVFKEQPLDYSIDEAFIKVRFKTKETNPNLIDIQGRVFDEKSEPLANVSVIAKHSGKLSITDNSGNYLLHDVLPTDEIVFSYIGYLEKQVPINGRTRIETQLSVSVSELDRTVVIAYGTTTQRFNTGNVVKVTAEEIEKQPVSNPLAALQARVPGLVITQTSGVPGSSFKVELRGQSVLDLGLSRNEPLIVIDGVPFEAGNIAVNQLTSAANNPVSISQGGLSPLNTISPSNIESMEVLKDADATAIYGSRGAGGVILITTKKGKPGKTSFGVNIYNGWSKANYKMHMLNTQQYLEMRKEGFANEAQVPTNATAPDLILWDTTRYTDFKKLLIGNTAHTSSYQLSLSGGSSLTQFLINGNYHRQTNVFSSDLSDQVASGYLQLNHQTADKKLNIQLSISYSMDKNNLIQTDLSRYINLPPNLKLYDSTGNLAWSEKGVSFRSVNSSFTNPLAELFKKYESQNENFLTNLSISYELYKGLRAKASAGFNQFSTDEVAINPTRSIDPFINTLPYSSFANANQKSWIIEPQLEWSKLFKKSKVSVLAGSTFQKKTSSRESISATNYANDMLLYSISGAGSLSALNNETDYRYEAIFGRVNYNWQSRYIINLTARRDGSSRFSPETRFANFGSAGAAWIFTNEKWFKVPFISYGKLRGSYGVTGNDQIGDYKFLNLWGSSSQPYGGVLGVVPKSLYNPDYNWEKTKKLEAGIELSLFKDRLQTNIDYYRHRSSNQLVNYTLPSQTGFFNIVQNLPALVQNSGVEAIVNANIFRKGPLKWNVSANITLPKNKLVSFPGLASSPYASQYVEGQSLNVIRKLKYLGVDPTTGLYNFEDVDKDGFWTDKDYLLSGNLDPVFYGGLSNSLSLKNVSFSFLIEYKKQKGSNYLKQVTSIPPGTIYNQPTIVLDRWRNQGDISEFQKFTSRTSGTVRTRMSYLNLSDGVYSDATFARLKTASLSFDFPEDWLKAIHFNSVRVYTEAQNLFTLTNYKGTDPESQNFYVLPPLKTIVLGVQVNL